MLETKTDDLSIIETQQILKDVLLRESIHTDTALKEAGLAYNLAYFDPPAHTQGSYENSETIARENRRIRMYMVSEVMKYLYPSMPPKTLLETFSAGDTSAALALPQTEVTSLDIDPQVFLNVPNNNLPEEVFKQHGKRKKHLGYGKDTWLKTKSKALTFVEKLIPNWHKKIGNTYHLPFPDNSFDAVLIQDKSYVFDSIPEASRVLTPEGYIIILLPEEIRDIDYTSAYQQKKTNDDIESGTFLTDVELKSVGLERFEIPDRFKQWEDLVRWKSTYLSEDGKTQVEVSSGFIIEVFKKSLK